MGDYDQYIEHFPARMKVNVGIPVPGGSVFHDWAIILDIDEDLLELQLSRDVLPAGVRLLVGTILDIRGGKADDGYSCRGIIVSEGDRREVLLRLIGEIVTDELREFYRIDAFLPIKYFITQETSEYSLKLDWQAKREARAERERERRENEVKPWQRLMLPQPEDLAEEELNTADEPDEELEEGADSDDNSDHSWDDVIPLAANISGGGIRILLHHEFKADDLIILEIYVPTEPQPRIVDAVGKVISSLQNHAASKQLHRNSYNTSIEFLFIDERDRDTIVSHISNVQLKRIRQLREQYLGRGLNNENPELTDIQRFRLKVFQIMLAIVVCLLLGGLALYFKHYVENRPKGEIEQIFEKGYMEYLKKIGRQPDTSPQ